MESEPWPEPLDTIRKTLVGELLKGKESAAKLQTLFQKPPEDRGGPVSAEELTQQISRSFTQGLSILNSCGVNGMSQILATDGVVRVSSGGRSIKTSDHSRKRPGGKDRRGCYRRRNVSQSWITFSATTEDEYAWRKYGQKEILNTQYPRCYFRCTHKHDQGCKATKQVQRIKEHPLMYQTTYFGHHTCQDTLMRAPQIISDSDPLESTCILSFETKHPTTQQYPRFPTTPAMIKPRANQEGKGETQSDASDNKSCLQDTSMLQQDIVTAESSGPLKDGAPHEEVDSKLNSSSSTTFHDLDSEAFGTNFADVDHALYFNDDFFQAFP